MDDYRSNVARVLDDVANGHAAQRTFDNFGPAHAGQVTQEILSRATTSVKSFSQRLSATVHSLDALVDFLDRQPDGTIEIVVEEGDVLGDPASALCGAVDFLRHPRVFVGVFKPKFEVEHVLIVDDRIARIETGRGDRTASVVAGTGWTESIDDALALFAQVRRLCTRIRA